MTGYSRTLFTQGFLASIHAVCRFRKLWHHPFRKLWHSRREEAPSSVSIS
jgi:hypothetical protein